MKYLTTEQKEFYKENGYIVLDPLTDQEIQELSSDYDEIFERKKKENLNATWKGDWNKDLSDETEVKSIHSMEMHSSVFSKLLLNDKILDACEDIMESSNILLHHSKAHYKPPGIGAPFPMHQDYHYFPLKNHSMVAVFISLDKSYPENGCLCVYPASHLLGPLKDVSTEQEYHYVHPKEFSLDKATPLAMEKGQVVIFSYLLVHGSYDNKSSKPRRMHLIQLMSAEDEILDKTRHLSHCQGMVLRGSNVHKAANIKKRLLTSEAGMKN